MPWDVLGAGATLSAVEKQGVKDKRRPSNVRASTHERSLGKREGDESSMSVDDSQQSSSRGQPKKTIATKPELLKQE
jgi:hypothetical protein